ncbi:methylation-associated defense system AAA family ATPase MAD3 [Pirellulaceae bacterium SH467]
MITRIEATRYRCLEFLDIDLQSFAVLVGANGAGKTTFLDILGLLGDCLRQREIGQAFTTRQNDRPARGATLNEFVFNGQGAEFILAIEAILPEEIIKQLLPIQTKSAQDNHDHNLRFIRYEVRFRIVDDRQLTIRNEYLFLFSNFSQPDRGKGIASDVVHGLRVFGDATPKKDWRFIIQRGQSANLDSVTFRAEKPKLAKPKSFPIDQGMLALPRMQFESAEEFPASRWLLNVLTSSCVTYHPDINLLHSASPPGLPDVLMPNAANLPWLVLDLQKDTERFNAWVQHVKTALPQISTIKAKEREDDHHAYLAVTYNGGYEVTSSGLSEGTLRVLALTVLPYLLNRPAVIVIEQPEDGIHPQAIEAVLQSLGSVYDSQVLISSHSPVVLAMSKLDQVLCSRIAPNGAATIVQGSEHPRLKEWKGTIDLGSLFAAGVLR